MWYEAPPVAHRLAHPFAHPGGPSVVAEAAAARRQRVDEFQQQASSAWQQLVDAVNAGLQPAHQQQQQQLQQQHNEASQVGERGQQLQQHQHQQQSHGALTANGVGAGSGGGPSPSAAAAAAAGGGQPLDLSGMAVPILSRRRLLGPVLLVPEPQHVPPGMTAQEAGEAAIAAAQAAQLQRQQQQQQQQQRQQLPMPALLVPGGCLALHSWRESAAADEPLGVVARDLADVPGGASAAAAAGGGGGSDGDPLALLPPAAAAASLSDDAAAAGQLLQPGSEVLITLLVLENSRRSNVPQQELQVLGSNTLADVADAIRCPTDALAAGLGADHPAAYFFIDGRFYDDTRAGRAAEGSQVLQQWASRLGLLCPRHLLQHHEPPHDDGDGGGGGFGGGSPPQQQQQQSRPRASGSSTCRDMHRVRLTDLVLQAANRPMLLYSHQGLCEHALIVKDVRLLHSADPQRRSAYPRTVFRAALARRLHCGVCKRLGATALLLDHPEAPEVVILLCRLCVDLFDVAAPVAVAAGARRIMLEEFERLDEE